jgi:carbon storage regulator
MLVIRRRPGESLFIGDDVELEVLEIAGSQVKLGIRAPKEVTVLRAEIHVTAEQNRAASLPAPPSAVALLRGSLLSQPRTSIAGPVPEPDPR